MDWIKLYLQSLWFLLSFIYNKCFKHSFSNLFYTLGIFFTLALVNTSKTRMTAFRVSTQVYKANRIIDSM